jgi:hypothetical protein
VKPRKRKKEKRVNLLLYINIFIIIIIIESFAFCLFITHVAMFPLLDESDYPFGFFLFTLRKEGSLSPSLPKFYPVVLCLPSGNMATNLVNQGLT